MSPDEAAILASRARVAQLEDAMRELLAAYKWSLNSGAGLPAFQQALIHAAAVLACPEPGDGT